MESVKLSKDEFNVIDLLKRKELIEKKERENIIEIQETNIDGVLDDYDQIMTLMNKLRPVLERKSKSSGINSHNMESNMNNDVVESLCKEMEILKSKLELLIPRITIVYIVCSSMSLSFFLTVFIIMIIKGIYIIHPFICITSIIGSLGLVLTSVASIKDWRKFIKDE